MKTPWKTLSPLDDGREYVAVATELVPKSRRSTGRLFRGAQRASAQMAHSPGVVGFSTLAQPLRKRYQTLSLWESEAAVDAFARSGDHHQLVRALTNELDTMTSTRWRVRGNQGRPTWKHAAQRLETANARSAPAGTHRGAPEPPSAPTNNTTDQNPSRRTT